MPDPSRFKPLPPLAGRAFLEPPAEPPAGESRFWKILATVSGLAFAGVVGLGLAMVATAGDAPEASVAAVSAPNQLERIADPAPAAGSAPVAEPPLAARRSARLAEPALASERWGGAVAPPAETFDELGARLREVGLETETEAEAVAAAAPAAIQPDEVETDGVGAEEAAEGSVGSEVTAGIPPRVAEPPPPAVSARAPVRRASVSTSARLRARPRNGATILTTLARGASVGVVECEGGWCEVVYEGKRGFVGAQFVGAGRKAPTAKKATAAKKASAAKPKAKTTLPPPTAPVRLRQERTESAR